MVQRASRTHSRGAVALWALLAAAAPAAPPTPSDSPAAETPLDVLRAGSSASGFAQVQAPRQFSFPQDHGPHPAYQHEWWYFTGHLQAANGRRYGFELTFFRVALAPPQSISPAQPISAAPSQAAGPLPSGWRARQIYAAHFAITDISRGRFHARARYARDALGLAGARADPWRVWLGGWSAGVAAGGPWVLRAADEDYALSLQLTPLGPAMLNGAAGLSVKADAPGAASYYYSLPHIAVRGQLSVGGEAQAVTGSAWLDREWGSGGLGPREQGWDWFAVQLADGGALMFYALRNRDGSLDPHSAGTFMAADGQMRPITLADMNLQVLGHWVSPRGARYPAGWRLRVSALGLDLQLNPMLANQELDTAPPYWEGAVEVRGSRGAQAVGGEGYVELVGYDDAR
jgi:predicted secreted hydrolase